MPSRRTLSWLLALADPDGPSELLPPKPLTQAQADDLWRLADRHGVLPAVVANTVKVSKANSFRRVLPPPPRQPSGQNELDVSLADPRETILAKTALTLAVRSQGDQITKAFHRESLPACIIKGMDFADRLYANPALRNFGDIDLLVPDIAVERSQDILKQLGYLPRMIGMKYDTGYGQQSFVRQDPAGGIVELHWNLVNSPSIRRGMSVEYDDLQFLPVQSSENVSSLPSPGSLLLIAAVHAAASHAFDRLLLLCDVCQMVREAAGSIDTDWLGEAVTRTGSRMALATALDLTGRLLREPRCAQLARKLRLPRGMLWRALLTKGVILRAHATVDSFRRNLFREMLKNPQ